MRVLESSIFTGAAALSGVAFVEFAVRVGLVGPEVARKLMHMGTGPLYVACWGLYDEAPSARWAAAAIPLGLSARFVLAGLGYVQSPSLVSAVSRKGRRQELLWGPLQYGLIHSAAAALFWRDSPTGVLSLMLLCAGDGAADLVGRRWGRRKWPHSSSKSYVGSAAFVLAGGMAQLAAMAAMNWAGWTAIPWTSALVPVVGVSVIAALVESLPFEDVDNITVFATSTSLYSWWFSALNPANSS